MGLVIVPMLIQTRHKTKVRKLFGKEAKRGLVQSVSADPSRTAQDHLSRAARIEGANACNRSTNTIRPRDGQHTGESAHQVQRVVEDSARV